MKSADQVGRRAADIQGYFQAFKYPENNDRV